MKRSTLSILAVLCAFSAGTAAYAAIPMEATPQVVLEGEEPAKCKRSSFKTALVKSACKKGLKAAIKAMKSFTKKAKAASGEKVNCKTCHSGLKKDGYPLKKDGMATYKRLKSAIDGAKVRPRLSGERTRMLEAWLR